jgi:hypothetical protein
MMSIESAFNLSSRRHKYEEPRVSRRERRAENGVAFSQANRASANVDVAVSPEGHAVRIPLWIRVGTTLKGASLDDKLAQGHAPDTSPLLAARAQSLVSPTRRRALAQNWLSLLVDAREPAEYLSAKIPLVRERIIGAKAPIEALAQALQAPMPTARGVAMASSLLSDGSGQIYNRACSIDFVSTVYEIIAHLDPRTTNG